MFKENDFVQRDDIHVVVKTLAGVGLSINTAYRVLHRQQKGLLTLEGYLMVVGEDQVMQATATQIEANGRRYNRTNI